MCGNPDITTFDEIGRERWFRQKIAEIGELLRLLPADRQEVVFDSSNAQKTCFVRGGCTKSNVRTRKVTSETESTGLPEHPAIEKNSESE